MIEDKKVYVYALSAVLMWSTVASAFSIALSRVNYLSLLFFAALVSFIVFVIKIFMSKRLRMELRRLRGKEICKSILLGGINPFLYYLLLFKAYSELAAQEAMTLNYTWVMVLTILSAVVYKQRLYMGNIVALVVSFTGVIVIATGGDVLGMNFRNSEGVVYALLSSVVWAVYWIVNMRGGIDSTIRMGMQFFAGCVYILLYSLLSSDMIDYTAVLDFNTLGALSYVGVFEMGVTFLVWVRALELGKDTAKIGKSCVSDAIFIAVYNKI